MGLRSSLWTSAQGCYDWSLDQALGPWTSEIMCDLCYGPVSNGIDQSPGLRHRPLVNGIDLVCERWAL